VSDRREKRLLRGGLLIGFGVGLCIGVALMFTAVGFPPNRPQVHPGTSMGEAAGFPCCAVSCVWGWWLAPLACSEG